MEREQRNSPEQKLELFFPSTLDQFGRSQFFRPEVNLKEHKLNFPFAFHSTNKASVQKRVEEKNGDICWSVIMVDFLMYLSSVS